MRRDIPEGVAAAQQQHAAGESASAWTLRNGKLLPDETYAVVLTVPEEGALRSLAVVLTNAGVLHRAIIEAHGPHAGQMTAIGVEPALKSSLRRFLSNLPTKK